MNIDQIKGNWIQLKGKVKEKWGQLTDNELTELDGNLDQLRGLLERKYGLTKEEAKKEVDAFFSEDSE